MSPTAELRAHLRAHGIDTLEIVGSLVAITTRAGAIVIVHVDSKLFASTEGDRVLLDRDKRRAAGTLRDMTRTRDRDRRRFSGLRGAIHATSRR